MDSFDHDDCAPIDELSAALDEIWRLRRALAYEARGLEASLDYKTFPKSRRKISEQQIRRMRDAAAGGSEVAYAGIRSQNLDSELQRASGKTTLTRHAFKEEFNARTRGS